MMGCGGHDCWTLVRDLYPSLSQPIVWGAVFVWTTGGVLLKRFLSLRGPRDGTCGTRRVLTLELDWASKPDGGVTHEHE